MDVADHIRVCHTGGTILEQFGHLGAREPPTDSGYQWHVVESTDGLTERNRGSGVDISRLSTVRAGDRVLQV